MPDMTAYLSAEQQEALHNRHLVHQADAIMDLGTLVSAAGMDDSEKGSAYQHTLLEGLVTIISQLDGERARKAAELIHQLSSLLNQGVISQNEVVFTKLIAEVSADEATHNDIQPATILPSGITVVDTGFASPFEPEVSVPIIEETPTEEVIDETPEVIIEPEVLTLPKAIEELRELLNYSQMSEVKALKSIFDLKQTEPIDSPQAEQIYDDINVVIDSLERSGKFDHLFKILGIKLVVDIIRGSKSGSPLAAATVKGRYSRDLEKETIGFEESLASGISLLVKARNDLKNMIP